MHKPIGDPTVLQRVIVANPRFNDVDSVVDCGSSVITAQRVRHAEAAVSVKPRPGELFKRLRPGSVANYVETEQRIRARMQSAAAHGDAEGYGQPATTGSELQDELDMYKAQGAPRRQMLILDVREREDYDRCHIEGAFHYPAALLSRAQNQFNADILYYKNRENHVIVLYDLDEEITVGRKVGNVFFERGIDNVLVMSGGLREFVQQYSAYIVGESPVPIVAVKPPRSRMSASRSTAGGSTTGSVLNAGALGHMGGHAGGHGGHGGGEIDRASTQATSIATSHKPKGLSTSLARPRGQVSSAGAWH